MGTAITTQVIPQGLLVPRAALGEWLERGVEAIRERERIIIRPRSTGPEDRLGERQEVTPRLSGRETELLREINRGLSPEGWRRYRELVAKRRAEVLTSDEQSALIAFTDQIEEANVRRIECLVELSQLRDTSLEVLMDQLGLKTPAYV